MKLDLYQYSFEFILLPQSFSFVPFVFSIWVFLSRTLTNHRTAGGGGGYFFNSSLSLPPALQTLRHQPGDYCRELTSPHSWQPDSNQEPLVSERKSLTTKLCALNPFVPNAPFLYPLKSVRFSDVFRGQRKDTMEKRIRVDLISRW